MYTGRLDGNSALLPLHNSLGLFVYTRFRISIFIYMNLHGLLGPSFFRSATTLMVNPKYEIFRNVEKMGVLVHNLSKSAQK